jgi:hypothetical protein
MSRHLILLKEPKSEAKPAIAADNELFAKSPDGLREIVRAVMQEMLETEMITPLVQPRILRPTRRLKRSANHPARFLPDEIQSPRGFRPSHQSSVSPTDTAPGQIWNTSEKFRSPLSITTA